MNSDALRRWLGFFLLTLLAASAVYGGDFFGVRDRLTPPATKVDVSPFESTDPDARARAGSSRRSQPYWRPVTRFTGSGPATTRAFTIGPAAIQWRARWRCERNAFEIQPLRPPGRAYGHALAQADDCPQNGTGFSVARGRFEIDVQATGSWTADVEEQVDVPLIEPPATGMTSPGSRRVASGRFYGIDEDGEGSVEIFRQADGSVSLRLEDFYVTPNIDLEIRLSELPRPETTKQVRDAPFKDIVFLRATSGEMNYRIPRDAFTDRVRSVVLWCEITGNAYAAASLRR